MSTQSRILIVEDVASYRSYLRQIVHGFGYSLVLEAENGREALGVLANNATDLVVTDYCMEPLSGLEVLRTAREYLGMSDLPFIMITGVGDGHILARAERYGVGYYLEKPLDVELFRESMRCALDGVVPLALSEKYSNLRASGQRRQIGGSSR